MNGTTTLVWLLMNDRADEHGNVAVSIRQIAYGTAVTEEAVTGAIKALEEDGHVERRGEASPPWVPSRYRLLKLAQRKAA